MTRAEVASALQCSERQIRFLEKRGAFPIPRLPRLGKRDLYSAELVRQFAGGKLLSKAQASRKVQL